jgi:ATP/maltotriose-dependent transcriptional regulator MalT
MGEGPQDAIQTVSNKGDTMTDTTQLPQTNGELPPVRESLVAQAERVHQEMLHERDALRRLLSERDTRIAGLEAQLQIAELNVSQMQSRIESSTSITNDAVARRAQVETVLASIMALGRAFNIQNQPLIHATEQESGHVELDPIHRPGGIIPIDGGTSRR